MKYTIKDKEYTLAKVTPKRLAAFAALLGIKDFLELKSMEVLADLNIRILNVGMDPEKVRTAYATCLNEDVSDIDVENEPLDMLDKVMNDFFTQRVANSQRPVNE